MHLTPHVSPHVSRRYGRHLVVSYAEEERSVEAMRDKLRSQLDAAAHDAADAAAGGRVSKKRKASAGTADDLDL